MYPPKIHLNLFLLIFHFLFLKIINCLLKPFLKKKKSKHFIYKYFLSI
jgi:hypothetical protein